MAQTDLAQNDTSKSSRTSMIRSSSHSDLASAPAADAKTPFHGSNAMTVPGALSSAPELNSLESLAMSWPPPGGLVGFPSGQQEKDATRVGCFIPDPEGDDYGRRLKSRMAVQRLAPTASPKARECALLLRSTSTLSVVPNSALTVAPAPPGAESSSSGPAAKSEQENALPLHPASLAIRDGSSSDPERRMNGASASTSGSTGAVLGANTVNEAKPVAVLNGGPGSAAAEVPPSSGSGVAEAQPLDPVHTQGVPTSFFPPTSTPQGPPLYASSHTGSSTTTEIRRIPPKAPASRPPSKPTADVSTSGSDPPLTAFRGPPGFPGRDRTAVSAPGALPLPPDEYGDPPPQPKLTETQRNYRQDLIRAILTNTGDRSRLHLSSSANELQEGASSEGDLASQGGTSEGEFGEGDGNDSEGGADVLRRSNSLPQVYRERYLVPNDEELEYEREEAGIGKNSPRPSTVSRTLSKSNGVSSKALPHKRPRLILHLDINKTIMIKDTAQDAGSDSMVNVLLSECAWGRLLPGPCWIPVGRLATDKPANDPELMTYRSYLDTFYLPLQRGFGPEIDRANEDIKHRRQALKRCFTAPGEPGAMFRGVYDKLLEELQVAEPKQAEMRACGLGDGKELVLLPSFFELLKHLKNLGRDFAIVFRTFGSDVMDVSRELNLFCEGRHPFHPDVQMNGQDGPTDLRLRSLEQYGCFYRQGFGSEGTMLAFSPPEEALRKHIARLDELEKCGECHWSFRDIYRAMIARCLEGGNIALAFRDYYPWWKAHQERARTGKLLLVDREDFHTRQVFFDDNIGTGSPHIVDVRDVSTGEPIPFTESNGKYLVKVEPLNAILDRQYFIRAVHRCEESIEGARDWRGFRNSPRLKNSKWDIARRKLLSIIRLGSGQI